MRELLARAQCKFSIGWERSGQIKQEALPAPCLNHVGEFPHSHQSPLMAQAKKAMAPTIASEPSGVNATSTPGPTPTPTLAPDTTVK